MEQVRLLNGIKPVTKIATSMINKVVKNSRYASLPINEPTILATPFFSIVNSFEEFDKYSNMSNSRIKKVSDNWCAVDNDDNHTYNRIFICKNIINQYESYFDTDILCVNGVYLNKFFIETILKLIKCNLYLYISENESKLNEVFFTSENRKFKGLISSIKHK